VAGKFRDWKHAARASMTGAGLPLFEKKFREGSCVERGRRDDQFEILRRSSSRSHSLTKVDVERPFVRFVQNQRLILHQIPVSLRLGQQECHRS